MKRFFYAIGAATLFVAAALTVPAHAQTEVIEAEGLGHTPYQVTREVCTSLDAICAVRFAGVPTGKRLVISNVSCGISLNDPSTIIAVTRTAQASTTPTHYLPIQFTAPYVSRGLDNYILDDQTTAIFNAGQVPYITVYTDNSNGFAGGICSVTGYLVTP